MRTACLGWIHRGCETTCFIIWARDASGSFVLGRELQRLDPWSKPASFGLSLDWGCYALRSGCGTPPPEERSKNKSCRFDCRVQTLLKGKHAPQIAPVQQLALLRSALARKELSAERVFIIFTTIGLSRAPLGGVSMGVTAVVDGLTAFRRLSGFVAQGASDVLRGDLGVLEHVGTCLNLSRSVKIY